MILFPTPEVPNDYLGRLALFTELSGKVYHWVCDNNSIMNPFLTDEDQEEILDRLDATFRESEFFKTISIVGQGFGVGGVQKYQVLNAIAGMEVRPIAEYCNQKESARATSWYTTTFARSTKVAQPEHRYVDIVRHIQGVRFSDTAHQDEHPVGEFQGFGDLPVLVRAICHNEGSDYMQVDADEYVESKDFDHIHDDGADIVVVAVSLAQIDNYEDEAELSDDFYSSLVTAMNGSADSLVFVVTDIDQLCQEYDPEDWDEMVDEYMERCIQMLGNSDLESCPIFIVGDFSTIEDLSIRDFLNNHESGVIALRQYLVKKATDTNLAAGTLSSCVSELEEVVSYMQENVATMGDVDDIEEIASDHLYILSKTIKKIDKNLHTIQSKYKKSK